MRGPVTTRTALVRALCKRLGGPSNLFRLLLISLVLFSLFFLRGTAPPPLPSRLQQRDGNNNNDDEESTIQEGILIFTLAPLDDAFRLSNVALHDINKEDDHEKKSLAMSLVCQTSWECARDTTSWGRIEAGLIERGGVAGKEQEESWRSPPFWLGWGFRDGYVDEEFKREAKGELERLGSLVKAEESSSSDHDDNNNEKLKKRKHWVAHSPWLAVTAKSWFEVIGKKSAKRSTCVFFAHSTRAKQLAHGLSKMGRKHLCALELMQSMDAARARALDACKSVGAKIWFAKREDGEFSMHEGIPPLSNIVSPEFASFTAATSRDDPDGEIALAALWLEAFPHVPLGTVFTTKTWPELPIRKDEAYVAVLTASNWLYAKGAMLLGRSAAFFDSSRERVLLATPDVDSVVTDLCERLGGWTIRRVEKIQQDWFRKCKWKSTRMSQEIRWGEMASKLHIFGMEDKKALVYMDADVVITGRLHEAFGVMGSSRELSHYQVVSEGGTQHEYINAGVLFIRPSHETFEGMMRTYKEKRPQDFLGNLVDCTEMGLINSYYGKPDRLAYRNRGISGTNKIGAQNTKGATMSVDADDKATIGRPDVLRDYAVAAPWAVHFMRADRCPKPWQICPGAIEPGQVDLEDTPIKHPNQLGGKHCNRYPYDVWCGLYQGTVRELGTGVVSFIATTQQLELENQS